MVGGDTTQILGLGVDVETGPPPTMDTDRLFLTEDERRALHALPDRRRPAELLRMWTLKESLFKADAGRTGFDLRHYTLDRRRRATAWPARPGTPSPPSAT